MFRMWHTGGRVCDGISRREWLRVGSIGLGGLSLPSLLQQRATAATTQAPKAKSVILLFNIGGIPQHDTWDPKPHAPETIRGSLGAISTRTPGVLAGGLLPMSSQLTEDIAIIRNMVTGDNAHSTSGYQMLTGVPHVPLNRENAGPGKPNDWPSLNAIVQALRPPKNGLPASVSLPKLLANNGGQNPWPGTDSGFLGRQFDPWFLVCDPSDPNFQPPGAELPAELSTNRFRKRLSLLETVDQTTTNMQRSVATQDFSRYQQQAIDLIAGGQARGAFDLQQEPKSLRDRYGRSRQGQSMLLARRLVEAGVSLVQVNWAHYDKSKPNNGGWDTHRDHEKSLKGWLMPVMDRAYSALIEDLKTRGLLEETLVCWVSEFGHTPKINSRAGRDHWGRVFCITMAGGGIRGGVVNGETDAHGGEPLSEAVRPCDYLATVFHCLGFSPETTVPDMTGRPIPISRGRVIESLLA